MATAQFPRQSGSRNPQRCVMGKGERGVITSCHGKARGRARFRHGSIQDPRMSAPRPLSGCHMLGQAAPAPEANGFSSCRLYIVPESKRGSGQPSTLPEAPPGSGLLPRNGSGHSTVPEPSAEAKRISHRTCCRPPLELRGGEGSGPLKPHGLGMRGGHFLKGTSGLPGRKQMAAGCKTTGESQHPPNGRSGGLSLLEY